MTKLATMTTILGGAMVLFFALLLIAPGQMRNWLKAFPRSRLAGAILTTVDLVWVELIIRHASLGRFEHLRPLLYLMVGPVLFVLILLLMRELLAPRALGGLFLLIPAPILAQTRFCDSPYRYVVIALAYILVIKGIILALSPYQFRKKAEIITGSSGICRLAGAAGLAFSIFVLVLGIKVF